MSPYRIEYASTAERHLRGLSARERRVVLNTVEQQLSFEAAVETRHRKRRRPNPRAPWELRIGDLRVYYDVEETPERVVQVLAVGVKRRNRVFIAGEEVEP